MANGARLVYSTSSGGTCATCGKPVRSCRCRTPSGRGEPVPVKVVAKLRIEKAGRGGKTVTVVYDLPRNPTFLKELAGELKRACGVGGTVGEDLVEVQGDVRVRVRDLLIRKGFGVKG
jgi:translation initiation factor 1